MKRVADEDKIFARLGDEGISGPRFLETAANSAYTACFGSWLKMSCMISAFFQGSSCPISTMDRRDPNGAPKKIVFSAILCKTEVSQGGNLEVDSRRLQRSA